MIALAIAGIVVASLFAVYDRTLEVGEQVREQTGLEQSARMIFMQLHRDLEGLYYRESENATEPGPYAFLGGEDAGRRQTRGATTILRLGSTASLGFARQTFPERGLYRVRYLLRGSDTGEEAPRTLVREQLPFPGIREDARRIALANNVSEVEIAFVPSGGGSRSSWSSAGGRDGENRPPLPQSVVFEMVLQSEGGTERAYRMRFAVNGSVSNEDG